MNVFYLCFLLQRISSENINRKNLIKINNCIEFECQKKKNINKPVISKIPDLIHNSGDLNLLTR